MSNFKTHKDFLDSQINRINLLLFKHPDQVTLLQAEKQKLVKERDKLIDLPETIKPVETKPNEIDFENRFEGRKEILMKMGFEYSNGIFVYKNLWSCFQEQIYRFENDEFKDYLKRIGEVVNKDTEESKKDMLKKLTQYKKSQLLTLCEMLERDSQEVAENKTSIKTLAEYIITFAKESDLDLIN